MQRAGEGDRSKHALARARDRLAACRRDRRGGISIVFCLGLMVLALVVCGGIEMADLFSERTKMRDVADSTALWGAATLALTGEDGVEERAIAYAQAQLAQLPMRTSLTVEANIVQVGSNPQEQQPALRIIIRGHRESFFGSLFPPGGFKVSVSSTALSVGKVPLCILAHGGNDAIDVKDSSNVVATGCLVHSNDDVFVNSAAKLDAGLTQAVNSASGPISPKANTGAKAIDDPFVDLPIVADKCPLITVPPLLHSTGLLTLQPGVHCRDIIIFENASLRLAPGEHWFVKAKIELKEDSRLDGSDTVLFFDKDSKFDFKDRSVVNLEGRKTGQYAGFLIVGTRDNDQNFSISSDNVETLLGTIYMPAAKLIVEGKSDVARDSPWTVIVAEQVELKGDPTLVMNTDYNIGGVPVPGGVGNKATTADTRIIK